MYLAHDLKLLAFSWYK